MRDGLSHPAIAIEIQSIQSILIYAKSLNKKAQGETGGSSSGRSPRRGIA
jgi:hypothetical protein